MTIFCGIVDISLRGTVGCLLLPGLKDIAAREEVELVCKLTSSHDPETGSCVLLCEMLEHPLEARFFSTYEDAWLEFTMKGDFNKAIFIDD